MNDLLEPDEKVLVCSVIVTAEYIIETTQQLEAKLKEKVDRGLADSIRFVFYILKAIHFVNSVCTIFSL